MNIIENVSGESEVTIRLPETFDFSDFNEFRDAYEKIASEHNNPGPVDPIVLIDCHNTQYIDSSALGMLVKMKNHLQPFTQNIRIVNCQPSVKKIFDICRFDKYFTIE